jgi:hypothetical protein
MKQLSLVDTQNLVSKLTKSLGERGAARALNKAGYQSPEGSQVRQGHVSRIQSGSYTQLLAPEEPIEAIPAPVPSPITARPPVGEPYPEHCIESGPALVSSSKGKANLPWASDGEEIEPTPDPREVRRRLREELLTEEADRKEREENAPPEVPRTSDYSRSEHTNLERSARVSGIFNRRAPVEFDEARGDYFGLPRLQRQPPKVTSKPYEPRSFAKLPMSPTEAYRLQSKKS